jgi:hypothetical protein
MKKEAGIGVMHPEAKQCQDLPTVTEARRERHGTDIPSDPLEGINPAGIFISDF